MNNTYGSTPTPYALQIARRDLKKINGNKLLIVFTDGDPNSMIEKDLSIKDDYNNLKSVSDEDTLDFNRYLIKQMKKEKITSFGIMLGDNSSIGSMARVFEKNFVVCNSIKSARSELIKVFRKTIQEFLNKQ